MEVAQFTVVDSVLSVAKYNWTRALEDSAYSSLDLSISSRLQKSCRKSSHLREF